MGSNKGNDNSVRRMFVPPSGSTDDKLSDNDAKSVEYVIDKILAYGLDASENVLNQIRWYRYIPGDDTWEYPNNLRQGTVRRFHLKNGRPVPDGVIAQATVG